MAQASILALIEPDGRYLAPNGTQAKPMRQDLDSGSNTIPLAKATDVRLHL